VKREAVIAGLASKGLALILGSAEVGSSVVVGPMPTDPVEFRKCARDLKALSAAKELSNPVSIPTFRPLPFNVSGNLKRELLKSNLVVPELTSI